MMTRRRLIHFPSGRDADPLSGATAELCSFGQKAALRMRISTPLVASEADNPSIKSQPIRIRPRHLTERPFLKQ